ncbi:hypothetical protein [Halorhabdus sp. BNX81]|uniref:hypothetical protein n=1 Tax=Halorhabdus sp. BNX81 TaxID=2980181 RepID=UPI0023DD61F7|nr:hypothetical protein [Halorhabdus sp. BNX81]
MKRRYYLQSLFGLLVVGGGCLSNENDGTPGKEWELSIHPFVRKANSEWEVELSIKNGFWGATFHNIELVLFDHRGELIRSHNIGNISGGGTRSVVLHTDAFPVVITATADESVCDTNVSIGLLYWIGTKDQRAKENVDFSQVWDGRPRRCDEDLPPAELFANGSDPTETAPNATTTD